MQLAGEKNPTTFKGAKIRLKMTFQQKLWNLEDNGMASLKF